jgi:hypothetical protein
MKKLFITLLFMTFTILLSAQDNGIAAAKYEYAYLYINETFDLKIHFEKGADTTVANLHRYNLKNGKNGLVECFDIFTKAFHFLENNGYEQIGSNNAYSQFGGTEIPQVPYFIFRRIKTTN